MNQNHDNQDESSESEHEGLFMVLRSLGWAAVFFAFIAAGIFGFFTIGILVLSIIGVVCLAYGAMMFAAFGPPWMGGLALGQNDGHMNNATRLVRRGTVAFACGLVAIGIVAWLHFPSPKEGELCFDTQKQVTDVNGKPFACQASAWHSAKVVLTCVEFASAEDRATFDRTGVIPAGSLVNGKTAKECKGIAISER